MPTPFEYMQIATGVYAASDRNYVEPPAGWTRIDWQPDRWTGFSAGVYKNDLTNEMVIAYTGTNDGIADPLNWTAGMGIPAPQIYDAMAYYFAFRAAFPSANITFTGHSLGGGLASLMAVLFDKQATVFDEAPFQPAAMNQALLPSFAAAMATAGHWDSSLAIYIASGGLLALSRESNVTQYYVEGEVLNTIRFSANTLVGNDNPIAMGSSTAGMVDRHSMALMTALRSSPSFLLAAQRLPDLVTELLDSNLFATDSRNPTKDDLLRKLLRHQLGVSGAITPDGMLERFAADMNKLAQPGGMTINESIGTWQTFSNWNNVCKALTAFSMQKYYDENSEGVGVGQALFNDVGGGIRFDTVAVVGAGNSIVSAKGYNLYFKEYLDSTGLFTPAERTLINTVLPTLRDWYVQAGATTLTATDSPNRGAFLLGGMGGDTLTGGTGANLLIGNAGADIFGERGDDILPGEEGNDIILATQGDDNLIDAGAGNNDLICRLRTMRESRRWRDGERSLRAVNDMTQRMAA